MSGLTALALGFAPGLFWLWFLYTRNRYRPEPRSLVIRVFLLGMASAVAAGLVETILILPFGHTFRNLEELTSPRLWAVISFGLAGPVEESCKLLAMRSGVYKSPYFKETTDGFLFSASASLGFATLENLGYAASFGWGVLLLRGPVSTLAHVVFSSLWGYGLIQRKLSSPRKAWLVPVTLTAAAGFHGLFDFLLFTQLKEGSHWWIWAYLMFGVGLIVYWIAIQKALRSSSFWGKISTFITRCPQCSTFQQAGAGYCVSCGTALSTPGGAELFCSNCHTPILKQSKYCPGCGYRLVRRQRPLKDKTSRGTSGA